MTSDDLLQEFTRALEFADRAIEKHRVTVTPREMGIVTGVGRGVARVRGLPSVQANELLRFPNQQLGLAFNLDVDEIGAVLLDGGAQLRAGDEARRTERVLDVPVGDGLLGRVIDPVGRPLDGRGQISAVLRMPCEREAPPIMNRAAVNRQLLTGIKVVDALLPIGRGQRELILGDRQTGKTSLAVGAILNQRGSNVVCIYCSIGQRSTTVARVVEDLRRHGLLNQCVIVVGEAESPPGLQFIAPYAATTVSEYFMGLGRDVLVVYDELGAHARAYRELSLLLRRPPGREAYPGDIFYVHSRLLERSTHLSDDHGGGSLTALPIIETEAQNVSAYIPTNLISITDGQIYLSPDRFQKGIMPAVDVGRSVSRVGGKAQLPAYRSVAGNLRLAYTQFEELERFARFSSQLDEETRRTLERGRRVRESLKQPLYHPLSAAEQIVELVTVTNGGFDATPISEVIAAGDRLRWQLAESLPDLCDRIDTGQPLTQVDIDAIVAHASRDEQPRDAPEPATLDNPR